MAADWSFGNLKGKAMGLLSDPEQQMGLLQNPMFNAGMGLLSSSYDPSINPWQAAMGGVAGAQQNKQAMEDRKRLEELRKQLSALILQQQQAQQQQQLPPGAMSMGGFGGMNSMGNAGMTGIYGR